MENDDGWKHDKIKKIFKLFKEGNVNEWKLLQSAKEKFRKENSEERTQEGWLIIVKKKNDQTISVKEQKLKEKKRYHK